MGACSSAGPVETWTEGEDVLLSSPHTKVNLPLMQSILDGSDNYEDSQVVNSAAEVLNYYDRAGLLGKGQFGKVYFCTKKAEGGKEFAMKTVQKSHFQGNEAEVKVCCSELAHSRSNQALSRQSIPGTK